MATQPNILVILTDQLRRDALSCYGDPNIATPHIDAMGAGGVRFDAACSTYPVCVPFRFTLMTGQYAHSRLIPAILWRMSPAERTLADEFNAAGYETIYVGKWHLYGGLGPSALKRPVPREHQGRWSRWFGFELRNAFFDTCWFKDDDPTPRPITGYQTDGLFDLAMEALRTRRDPARPFALILSVEAPHPPFEAPPEFAGRWLERDIELPPNFFVLTEQDEDATGWSAALTDDVRDDQIRRRKLYYAMIDNLDWNVGRLSRFLEENGLTDRTVTVFTSDHGELGGSHQLQEKQYPFAESTGIPLLVRGPGIPAGGTVADPVCSEDLFPTILGLAGLTPRDPMPGLNLTPQIAGDRTPLPRPGVMLEFVSEIRPGIVFSQRVYRGFRSRRYTYTVFGGDGGMRPWQFFDLERDPCELNNLVADAAHEGLARQHHGWLRDRMVETGDHAWLAPAFGFAGLNAWATCELKAHRGEFERKKPKA